MLGLKLGFPPNLMVKLVLSYIFFLVWKNPMSMHEKTSLLLKLSKLEHFECEKVLLEVMVFLMCENNINHIKSI
jgi:hypothetical protein